MPRVSLPRVAPSPVATPRAVRTKRYTGARPLPAAVARAVVRHTADGLVVLNPTGIVSVANPAAGRLLGTIPSQLIGRPLADALPAESSARLLEAMATHRRTPTQSVHIALRHRHGGGQGRSLDAIISQSTGNAAVGGMVVTFRDATATVERHRQLAHRAFHDPLTGLPNRAALLDLLGRDLDRAARDGQTAAFLLLDLDRFKTVNDSLGHAAGDLLLVCVANRLRAAVRPGDLVARLGGDEFACLLRGVADTRSACDAARRVLFALEESIVVDGCAVVPGASIGVAFLPGAGKTASDVLRAADAAMYTAKRRGRGCIALFDGQLADRDRVRLSLEAELRRALLQDELRLEFQPLIDLTTGEIRKAEALVRWAHPERGILAAGDFVPMAEETGLIIPVGQWVVREACRQVRIWQAAAPHTDVAVNVNLSALQLRHPGITECVISALDETGLDPQSLTLELTESVALADLEAASRVLRQLHRIGVRLALDDFGTGHSSLGYLHRLPVDDVKIDRSFVAGLGSNRVATAIVAAVTSVANAVGLTVTAEGIETAHQLRSVGALGCDLGQGHFIGRPQAASAIAGLLAATPRGHSPDTDALLRSSNQTRLLGADLSFAAD